MKYILNVTTKCPNYFEGEKEFVYKRIAAIDTGTQKLSQHFSEAFDFIGKRILYMHWEKNSVLSEAYELPKGQWRSMQLPYIHMVLSKQ